MPKTVEKRPLTTEQVQAQELLTNILDGVKEGKYSLVKFESNSRYRVSGLEETTDNGKLISYEIRTKGAVGSLWSLVRVVKDELATLRSETDIVDRSLVERLKKEVYDRLSTQEIENRREDDQVMVSATQVRILRELATESADPTASNGHDGHNGHENGSRPKAEETVVFDASLAN